MEESYQKSGVSWSIVIGSTSIRAQSPHRKPKEILQHFWYPPNRLNDTRNSIRRLRREQQVYVVGHQDIGMVLYTITLTRIPQDVAIEQVVIIGEKTGVTVVPPGNK